MQRTTIQLATLRNSVSKDSSPISTTDKFCLFSMRTTQRTHKIARRGLASLVTFAGLLLPAVAWASGPAPSVTTLDPFPSNNVTLGTTVELLALVSSGGNAVPFGVVNFCNAQAAACVGPNLLGQAELTNSPVAGTAAAFVHLGIGTYLIKAVFLGQQTIATSSSSIQTVTVTGRYNTKSTLTATGSAGNYTLTGVVTAAGKKAPTGSLAFIDSSDSNFSLGSVVLTAGSKVFSMQTLPLQTVGLAPQNLVVADFDGDGNPDIAITQKNSVQVLYGDGMGGSSFSYQIPLSGAANLVAGDFNGDGIPDLAVTDTSANRVHILQFAGNRSFSEVFSEPAGDSPEYIAAADLDGNGTLDLLVGDDTGTQIKVIFGTGFGTLDPAKGINNLKQPGQFAVADFNNDGKLDFAVGGLNGLVTVYFGDGIGNFTVSQTLYGGANPAKIVAGDFNGDGAIDLAAISDSDNLLTVYLNNNGILNQKGTYKTGTTSARVASIAVGDFNGDGFTDIAYMTSTTNPFLGDSPAPGTLTILKGKGDGTFSMLLNFSTGSSPWALAAGDWNGDGLTDLVVNNTGDNNVGLWQSVVQSPATAVLNAVAIPGSGSHGIYANYVLTTLDHSSKSKTVDLTGTPVKTKTTLTVSPGLSVTHGQTVQLTAVVTPQSPSNMTITSNVKFLDGTKVLATVAVSGGQAVFSINSLAVGSHSLTAVFTGGANFVTSTSAVSTLTVH